MPNNTPPRTARLDIIVPPALKRRWQAEARKRRWTLTTLIEVAISEYLESALPDHRPPTSE